MTATTTATTTEPPVVVNPALLQSVKEYIKANDNHNKTGNTLESKNWILVDEALKLVDQGFDHEAITTHFRAAFDKATEKVDPKSVARTTYRLTTTKVANIAVQGREWVEDRRKNVKGFFSSYEAATEILRAAKNPTPEIPATTTNGEDESKDATPASSNRGKTTKTKSGTTVREGKAAGKSKGTASVTSDQEAAITLDYLLNHPEELIQVIDQMLDDNVLSKEGWQEIIEKITKKLKG